MIWALCWSCAVLIANGNYCWKRRTESERVGGKQSAVASHYNQWLSIRLLWLPTLQQRRKWLFGSTMQLVYMHSFEGSLSVLVYYGAFSLTQQSRMTNQRLQWIRLSESRVKFEQEHSMSACSRLHHCGPHSGCPLAPEAVCVLWPVTASYRQARGSAVLFRGHWPLHWPLTLHLCTNLHC